MRTRSMFHLYLTLSPLLSLLGYAKLLSYKRGPVFVRLFACAVDSDSDTYQWNVPWTFNLSAYYLCLISYLSLDLALKR